MIIVVLLLYIDETKIKIINLLTYSINKKVCETWKTVNDKHHAPLTCEPNM